jgi:hypothetical protein
MHKFPITNWPRYLVCSIEIGGPKLSLAMTYCGHVVQNIHLQCVATLALGSRPRLKGLQGCGPRGSPRVTSHTLGSVRKCEGVWGSEPSHSQGNSHFGRWSPGGLPKLQRAIAGVKPQCIVAKWRARSRTANLTPDHKKSGIDPIYLSIGGVSHIIGKLSMRATTLL